MNVAFLAASSIVCHTISTAILLTKVAYPVSKCRTTKVTFVHWILDHILWIYLFPIFISCNFRVILWQYAVFVRLQKENSKSKRATKNT